jgi:hypothetical protein
MLENNEAPTSVEAVTIREGVDLETRKPTYEALEIKLAFANEQREYFQRMMNEHLATINQACTAIQEVLAGDMNALETFDSFREGFELLGVELMVERSWTVQATWTVTGKVPLDYTVDAEDFEPDLSLDWSSQIEDVEVSFEGMDADQD